MGSLTNLDLHANGLSGTLPASFYNLVNLQYVFLANNQLQGTVGNGIARLTKLASLNLAFNVLSGSFPAVTGLTGLRGLQLQSNRFTATIPEALGALTGLQQLQLQQNALTGTLPDVWGSFPSLTLLGLFGNLFTGALPPSLVSSQLSNFADLVNPPVTVCPPGAVASGASVTDGVSGSATRRGHLLEWKRGVRRLSSGIDQPPAVHRRRRLHVRRRVAPAAVRLRVVTAARAARAVASRALRCARRHRRGRGRRGALCAAGDAAPRGSSRPRRRVARVRRAAR